MKPEYLFAALALLQLGDIYTTYKCLTGNYGVEGNPIVLAVMKAIGVLPALYLIKGVVIAMLAVSYKDIHTGLMLLLIGYYTYIVYHNFKIYKK